MSVYIVYKQNGVKMMRPVLTREEYVKLRNSGFQRENVARIRQGETSRPLRVSLPTNSPSGWHSRWRVCPVW